MTTIPRKTFSHKKARAISSGFLELIKAFVLIPGQGLAGKQTLFRSVLKHYENDHSITVFEFAPVRADKSTLVWFLTPNQAGGM